MTQAAIGHSAATHRGGHAKNRSRRRQARRGKNRTGLQAEHPRADGGSKRLGKARQRRRGRGLAGPCRRRRTKQERRDKSRTLSLHSPRRLPAQGGSGVEEERDTLSRGGDNSSTTGRQRREQHRLGVIGSLTRPDEVIPGQGACRRAAQARDTWAFTWQLFYVAPSVVPGRLRPRSRSKIMTQEKDMVVAQTTRTVSSCFPVLKKVIPVMMRWPQRHNWVQNRRGCSSKHRPDCSESEVFPRGGFTDVSNQPGMFMLHWCMRPTMQPMWQPVW